MNGELAFTALWLDAFVVLEKRAGHFGHITLMVAHWGEKA